MLTPAGPIELRFTVPAVLDGVGVRHEGMGVPDVRGVDADQSRVARLIVASKASQVDNVGIGRVVVKVRYALPSVNNVMA